MKIRTADDEREVTRNDGQLRHNPRHDFRSAARRRGLLLYQGGPPRNQPATGSRGRGSSQVVKQQPQRMTNASTKMALSHAVQQPPLVQKPVVVPRPDWHDKLYLAQLKTGVLRTLVGSAGITKDVIANTNAEGFLALDLPDVYNRFMKHHERSRNTTISTTTPR